MKDEPTPTQFFASSLFKPAIAKLLTKNDPLRRIILANVSPGHMKEKCFHRLTLELPRSQSTHTEVINTLAAMH